MKRMKQALALLLSLMMLLTMGGIAEEEAVEPIEAAAEEPIEEIVEEVSEEPEEDISEEPADVPEEMPTEEVIEDHSEEFEEESEEAPIEDPTEGRAEDSVEDSSEETDEEPVVVPVEELFTNEDSAALKDVRAPSGNLDFDSFLTLNARDKDHVHEWDVTVSSYATVHYEYQISDANVHLQTAWENYSAECKICHATKDGTLYIYTGEPHVIENGKCTLCGDTNVKEYHPTHTQHSWKYTGGSISSGVSSRGDLGHNRRTRETDGFKCTQCGSATASDAFNYERLEPHTMQMSGNRARCSECSYVEEIPLVERIQLSQAELSIMRGDTAELKATLSPATKYDDARVKWSSSDESIATVVGGKVYAVGVGTAWITCSAADGSDVSSNCQVTVTAKKVDRIRLDREEITLFRRESATLIAIYEPSDIEAQDVTWTSSQEGVATVQDGVVSAISVGETTITCSSLCDASVQASCVVTVSPNKIEKISLTGTTLFPGESKNLFVNRYAQFTPEGVGRQDVRWSSSNEEVATIEDGQLKALSVGDTTITCISLYDESVRGSCEIHVIEKIPATGIQLDPQEVVLWPGQSQVVQTRYLPSNATYYDLISFQSTDEAGAIFRIDEVMDGTVIYQTITATGAGQAELHYYFKDEETGYKTLIGTRRIRVTSVFNKLPLTLTLCKGSSQKLKVSSIKSKGFSYTSDNTYVATIDQNGKLKAKNEGSAIIYVTDNATREMAYFELTVTPTPASIAITGVSAPTKLNLGGEPLQLYATVSPAGATQEVTWKSSKPKIVSVDKNTGLVRALKQGKATITATTIEQNKKGKKLSAKVAITVVDPTRPTGIKIDQKSPVQATVGEKLQLSATMEPATAVSALTWTIDKKQQKYATIDANGLLTAKKKGSVTVKVSTKVKKLNKKAATATIKVKISDPIIPASATIAETGGAQIK